MIATFALLALVGTSVPSPAPAVAAVAPRPAGTAAAPTAAQREAALRALGFSPAGATAVIAGLESERALMKSAMPDIRAGRAALVVAVQAKPFNEAAVEPLIRNQQARSSRLTAQLSESRIALMRSLPPADQAIYAKQLVLGSAAAPNRPATDAAGTQPK